MLGVVLDSISSLDVPADVVVAVSGEEFEREWLERRGVRFATAANSPLGAKVNAAVGLLEDCDCVMGIGSDDLVCSRYVRAALRHCETVDMAGALDIYLYELKWQRLYYWAGYTCDRRLGETVGPGRMVTRRVMDLLDWSPFDAEAEISIDRTMHLKLAEAEIKTAAFKLIDEDAMIVDVKSKTNLNPMLRVKQHTEVAEVPDHFRKMAKHFGAYAVESLDEVPA
jgi:hypothetical protein